MIEAAVQWKWVLFVLLAAAAICDICAYRIPNALSAAAIIALALIMLFSGAPAIEYARASASGLIGLGVGYGLYAIGWMGAGDGKLFAAASSWFSPSMLLAAGFLVSLSGVIVALIVLGCAALARLRRDAASPAMRAGAASAMKTPVPYGVAIAAGFMIVAQLPGPAS